MVPKGFERIEVTNWGPKGRGAVYRVVAENGTTYTVTRHEWVLPFRRWAWAARPDGGGKAIYEDTLADLEFELFPKRVEEEGR